MFPKRPLLVAVCVSALLGLAACQPGQSTDNSESELFVSTDFRSGVSGYRPTGYGWKPNSKVEISIWHEPNGPGSVISDWKKIPDQNVDVHVDAMGMFGFDSGALFYPVRRSICGAPENNQTILFMAKSLTTGKIRMRQVSADLYFTFNPCA